GLYTSKENTAWTRVLFPNAATESFELNDAVNEQFGTSLGVRADLGNAWSLDVRGALSTAQTEVNFPSFIDTGTFTSTSELNTNSRTDLVTAAAVLDGPLFSMGTVTPRAALGVEGRREEFART